MAKFKKEVTATLMSPVMNDGDWFYDEVQLHHLMKRFEAARVDSAFVIKLNWLFEAQGL